jgi:hypothetical protein
VPGLDEVTTIVATSATDLWFFDLPETGGKHWDGRAWHRFTLRVPRDYAPYDVKVVGPDDVWVAAHTYSGSEPSVFAHWDGRAWTDHPGPWLGTGGSDPPHFLPAASAAGLWALDGPAMPERWDGQAWRAVKLPGITGDSVSGFLTSAFVSPGPGEVWLPDGIEVEHWTGTAWQRLRLPGDESADKLTVGPGGDLWVSTKGHQLLHREGSSWREVPVTSKLGSFDGQLAADGQGGLWLSVGDVGDATVDRHGLHGAVGGLVHRTAAGAVTEVAGPRPSYAKLRSGAPTDQGERLPTPWQDEIRTTLLAVTPGTVWFTQDHRLDYPPLDDGEYHEDYATGDLTLLQRYSAGP